ncbi:MAG: hypothetical protein JF616_02790 [Fibrobacteres bacterium]|jgi:hypothetical protein|nr:hypothetical protein [Fibrobacterota bacterium]
MLSKNADFLKAGLIEQARRLTPAQRLDLFVEHSKLMRKLREMGERRRGATAISKYPDEQ